MQKNVKKQSIKNEDVTSGHKNRRDEKGNGSGNEKKITNSKDKVSRHPTTEPNPGG